MGAKKVLPVYKMISDGVMTGTDVIESDPTNTQNLDNIAIQVAWTGDPTGTIEVMGSVDGTDYQALVFDPTLTQPAGSSGGYLINLNQYPYPLVKLRYTNATGDGVFNASIFGKDLN